jgi:hypothetical protein
MNYAWLMAMKKTTSVLALALLVVIAVAGILLVYFGAKAGDLYTFRISVEEEIYTLSVRSNCSSAPDVSYSGLLKSVSVDFTGEVENVYCNITIPNNLIWGELTVYAKSYEMSEDDYILSSDSTSNSVYFTFDNTALGMHFEIKGTEGA